MDNLKEIIFQLENKLQQPDIRKSAKELDELISDDTTHSLRSFLWKNENGKWKMIFHQGTSL